MMRRKEAVFLSVDKGCEQGLGLVLLSSSQRALYATPTPCAVPMGIAGAAKKVGVKTKSGMVSCASQARRSVRQARLISGNARHLELHTYRQPCDGQCKQHSTASRHRHHAARASCADSDWDVPQHRLLTWLSAGVGVPRSQVSWSV